ncbi:MAG: hypothetical protein CMJ70_00450 [Planctomycetaceae bacterium]|nr:hypothetical protein [Planctomycetaceae bacterium]
MTGRIYSLATSASAIKASHQEHGGIVQTGGRVHGAGLQQLLAGDRYSLQQSWPVGDGCGEREFEILIIGDFGQVANGSSSGSFT